MLEAAGKVAAGAGRSTRTEVAGSRAAPSAPARPWFSAPLRRWRPWALPVAAAAALALWLGANATFDTDTPGAGSGVEVVAEYDPFGAWPGTDGEVAGAPVLSDLSMEQLEALLEEMES